MSGWSAPIAPTTSASRTSSSTTIDAAAEAFRQALQIDPNLGLAHLNLAIALLYGSHLDQAAPEARAAASRRCLIAHSRRSCSA